MNPLYFASPWFLFGFFSLIIPFLLLLSRAAPHKTILFSSVEFLASITKRASAVLEWKRIFLLLCRLALLSLLALGFALPFLKKGGSLFGNRNGEHRAFVLDNSYSMGYAEKDKPSLFEQAKQKIADSVKADPKAGYSLFLFNSKLETVVSQTSDGSLFLKRLAQTSISESESNFSVLFPSLAKSFSGDKRPLDFLIFSDFSIPDPKAKKVFEAEAVENLKTRNLQIVPVQPGSFRNFLVRDVEMPFRPFLPGTKETVRVFYEAYGYEPGEEVEISLLVENVLTRKQKIKIPASLKGSVSFEVEFPSASRFPLRIESGPDGLPLDNVRYAAAFVHAPLHLLFIEDSDYAYPFDRPNFYFNHALQSSVDAERPWLNAANANIRDLGGLPLENYDFVVLADIVHWESRAMNQFKAYLKAGGAMLVAFGKNGMDQPLPDTASQQVLSQFVGAQVGEVLKKKTASPAHLEPLDYAQSFLQVFEGGKQGNLQGINFWKFVPLMPLENESAASKGGSKDSKTLLWFDSKWPALFQRKIGSGTLLVWTSSLNQEWTDFPKNSLYVPFVLELLKSVTLPEWGRQLSLKVGEPVVFTDVLPNAADPILMKDPKGESTALYRGKGSVFPSFPTPHAGFYEWTAGGRDSRERNLAACNVDPRESRPGYIRWDPKVLGHEKEAAPSAGGEDTGVVRHYLYPSLFHAIFFLLLLEAAVANQMYKPKWV